MTHVSKLKSNVKGEFDIELAPRTLIVGKNKSGKSRIVEALSIALTGSGFSDGLGKRELDLMTLKPIDDKGLWIEAELDDNTMVGWAAVGTTTKSKKAEWTTSNGAGTPIGTLIAHEATAILRYDKKKLRESLITRMALELPVDVLKREIPTVLWPEFETFLGGVREHYGATELLAAVGSVDKDLKSTRSELKAVKREMLEDVQGLTDGEEEELTQMVRRASAKGITAEELVELKAHREKLILERDRLAIQVGTPSATGDVAQAELVSAVVRAQRLILERLYSAGVDKSRCPVCQTVDVSLEQFGRARELLEGARAAMQEQQDAAEKLGAARRRLEGLTRELTDTHTAIQDASVVEEVDHDRLRDLQEKRARGERSASIGDKVVELSGREARLGALKTQVSKIVANTLDARTGDFEARVNAALPEGMGVTLKLREGSREVCKLKLRTADGEFDLKALCGAEKVALISAFAAATVETDGPPVRMLIVDDVWLDPISLQALLEALGSSVGETGPTQVVVSVVDDSGVEVNGWHRIEVGV